MNKQLLLNFFKLRIIIGALGEFQSSPWWATAYINPTSEMFLKPVFTKTHHFAQYQGVKEAARRVHDELIGVGKVYHLFRLPEEIEYELQNLALSQPKFLKETFENLTDLQKATAELLQLAENQKNKAEGPIRLGSIKDLSKSTAIATLAQHYLGAFSGNRRVYPYFAD